MDTSVNAANQVVSVGADIAFDADPKFFACLVRFESSSVPTTLPTAYDVYPLDGRHDGGYYTVKDCVTIDVLPRTPGNNAYVGFMVWSNFTATKCRGLVSLNQVDRKSGSAGMPRPISYAVFCLKKKKQRMLKTGCRPRAQTVVCAVPRCWPWANEPSKVLEWCARLR